MKVSLEVKVKDNILTRDILLTSKYWIDRWKRFYTVKLLPPPK